MPRPSLRKYSYTRHNGLARPNPGLLWAVRRVRRSLSRKTVRNGDKFRCAGLISPGAHELGCAFSAPMMRCARRAGTIPLLHRLPKPLPTSRLGTKTRREAAGRTRIGESRAYEPQDVGLTPV